MRGLDDDIRLEVKPRDLLRELSLKEQSIELSFDNIPDGFYQELLEQLLERDYLNDTGDKIFCDQRQRERRQIQWLQITRLPVHPNQNESYDLLSRWQGMLSSLHAWGYRLLFLLLRHNGQTKLYLGATASGDGDTAEESIEQIREAAFGSMPGMDLRTLTRAQADENIKDTLDCMEHVGAVTGIPSFRKEEKKGILQTLDALAFGIRDGYGAEKDYAMLVIADPIQDKQISDIISNYRRLGSEIHTAVKLIEGQGLSRGESGQKEAKLAAGIGMLGNIVGALAGSAIGKWIGKDNGQRLGAIIGSSLGGQAGGLFGSERTVNVGGSASTSTEHLDKFAEYAEQATEHHIGRLNEGRNLGFWNTGVYVLGTSPNDVKTVTGMLRSVYSGDESYFEPIRLHLLRADSNAASIVRGRFSLIPMDAQKLPSSGVSGKQGSDDTDNWHLLGSCYQYLSTPINTKELSLATSLPRRDVPGLRFVKTAVRFANNPAQVDKSDKITLGNIMDMGVMQNTTYDIDVNSLVRHALVAGSTGSGKSTTCKRIVTEVIGKDIPVMVIEPAKDDYVRWAIKMNEKLPPHKQFKIYMPGVDCFERTPVERLKINPFEPAAVKGAKVDLLQHSEHFSVLLNACLPADEVVPILIEEVVYETIREVALDQDRRFEEEPVEPLRDYPNADSMLIKAKEIMRSKIYADRNRDNLTEVLLTRFKYLKRGMRGRILNVHKSTDYSELFSGNVIINLSRLSGTKDKSLIMSLLMQALYEYRQSCYAEDPAYRRKAQDDMLLHLLLVEEAHNVLQKPLGNQSSGSPERAAADLFDNMLSDVRAYGQGLLVVDQVPTRLIDGATKNTNYKIVHRLASPDDQETMAACMAFRDDQRYIIPNLEVGNAIICGDKDDAAAWVKIPKPGQDVRR